jgi:hypothetical protein
LVDSWRLCYLGDFSILEDIAILDDLAIFWSLDYDALVLIDVLEGLLHFVVVDFSSIVRHSPSHGQWEIADPYCR